MAPQGKAGQVFVQLDMGEILDVDQLDMLTRNLMGEIIDYGIDDVDVLTGGKAPGGTKGGDPVTWGVLAVSVLPAMLPKLVEFLQSWAMREESRKVKVSVQDGEKSISLEYSPKITSREELDEVVAMLSAQIQKNG